MIYSFDEAIKQAEELEAHAWDGMTAEEIQMAKETEWKPDVVGLVREIKLLKQDYAEASDTSTLPHWLTSEQKQFIEEHPVEKVVWDMGWGIEVEMETEGVIVANPQRTLLSRTSTRERYVYWRITPDGRKFDELDKWQIANFIPKEVECNVSKEERWRWCVEQYEKCEITKLYRELLEKAEKWGGVTVRGEKSTRRAPTMARYRSREEMEEQRFTSREGIDRGERWQDNPELSNVYMTEEELKDRDFKFMLRRKTMDYIKAMCREHFWSAYSKSQQWEWELEYYRFWRRGIVSETVVDREVASIVIALEHWRYIARQELKQVKIVGTKVKYREMGKKSKRTDDMIGYMWRKLPEGLQCVIG